jgi:4-methyl-5(b-hydroxyethyl)-thiazole monophosphate biosynthesis
MTPNVLVPIADGTEEIEAVCIIDVLRRAGADVTVAAAGDLRQITASRGVRIVADKLLAECLETSFDLIALPGGIPGAENLRDSADLARLLSRQRDDGKWLGAICAAPAVVFQHHGLLENTRATSHPAFMEGLDPVLAEEERVVVDGRIVTSRGPGTALEFSLQLVEILFGREKAREVAAPMLVK